ncbi:Fe-S cluster assembly protein SufD [Candidatus Woesearchaeota archaeon]|nr:Fe-S cluster assembly protein SufD [Candidatus Woesearchaeota archaeon]
MQSTNTIKETELSEETVRQLSKAKNEPDWLLQRRLEALKQFENLPMPQLSYGLHVNASPNISLNELKPLEHVTNHSAQATADAEGIAIEDLSTAAVKYENVLMPLMQGKGFRNKLEAMHAAFWNNGVFVYAKNSFGNSGKNENSARAQLLLKQKQTEIVWVVVAAEENSGISITESLVSEPVLGDRDGREQNGKGNGKNYRVEVVDILAGQGAKVNYATLQRLGSNVQSLISRNAAVENRAAVDWIDVNIGGGSTRQEIVSVLNGEGASSTMLGAFFGDENQQLDITAKAVHNARNTASNMKIKGALKGRAKAIVQSFTKIMANAANSEGHQKANILLLSDTARASPIPKLEIDNYDVKASHEASVGQLDKEKLFYMMSRGLGSRDAAKLVVEGFFEPLLKQIPFEGLTDDLRHAIKAKMEDVGEELLKNA